MGKLKSSVPATTKALQAWQSELRRLEKRLEEWSNDLATREKTLEQQEAAFEQAVEGADGETVQLYADLSSDETKADGGHCYDAEDCYEKCYCSQGTCNLHPYQDYGGDCGCTPGDADAGCDCPKCERVKAQKPKNVIANQQRKATLGDEVQWLENLWSLEDKRKKKK